MHRLFGLAIGGIAYWGWSIGAAFREVVGK